MLFCSTNSSSSSEYINLLLLILTCRWSNSWQSYVLDVHPFNPRIAMSAGYDGQTIIWDVSFMLSFLILSSPLAYFVLNCLALCFQIWEGTPIKIYEVGHVKLVDGKFSA